MMKEVKDNFSEQSALYHQFRPSYPEELINTLCRYATETNLAWDCATGNGQVARILSKKFKEVIATDISSIQIDKAPTLKNVCYKVERSENSSLPNGSVDLIMVAQAIHWFDFKNFYAEAKRVLKKGATIAVIGYPLLTTENTKLDELLHYFYTEVVGGYWDAERNYVDKRYTTIPFPFDEFHLPKFEMTYCWTSRQFLGYLESWSAVGHYKQENNANPLDLIRSDIEKMYAEKRIEVRFEIIGRYGRHL